MTMTNGNGNGNGNGNHGEDEAPVHSEEEWNALVVGWQKRLQAWPNRDRLDKLYKIALSCSSMIAMAQGWHDWIRDMKVAAITDEDLETVRSVVQPAAESLLILEQLRIEYSKRIDEIVSKEQGKKAISNPPKEMFS